ncbi:Spy0128 family protein, partial [Schaalia hyovaginalis]|uniref:Spy0128 family protein n=1 Tax=Schaalia hyovaginalis TaxID=29316 RepID=UPI001F344F20
MSATSRSLRALLVAPLALALSGLVIVTPAQAAAEVSVASWAELETAINHNDDVVVTLTQDIVADKTLSIDSGKKVVLRGDKTIYRVADPESAFLSMFQVNEGGSLSMGTPDGSSCVNMSGKAVSSQYELLPSKAIDSLDPAKVAQRRFVMMRGEMTDAFFFTFGEDGGIGKFGYQKPIANDEKGVVLKKDSFPLLDNALLKVVARGGSKNKGNAFQNPKTGMAFGLDSAKKYVAAGYPYYDPTANASGIDFYFTNEITGIYPHLRDWERSNTNVNYETDGSGGSWLEGKIWAGTNAPVQLRELVKSPDMSTLAAHRYSAAELGLDPSDGIDKGGFFISNTNGAVNVSCGSFSDFTTGPLPVPTPWSIQDAGVDDWSVGPGTIAPIYNTGAQASFTMTGGTISNNEVGSNDRMANENGINDTVDANGDGLITFDEVKDKVIALGDAKEPFKALDFSKGRYNFGSRAAGAIILNDGATGALTNASISSNKGDAGAIIVNRSKLTVDKGTKIDSNEGLYLGGAINVNSIDGEGVTMNGGEISNNKSVRQGAVYTQGPAGKVGGLFTLNGGSLHDNYSLDKGGAIRVASNGVTLNNGDIYGNKSWVMGGAIYVNGDSPQNSRTLVLNDGSIYNNRSVNAQGIGADGNTYLDGATDDSRVRGFVPGSGGGVWVCPYGTFVFDASRVIIDDNSAKATGVDFFKEVGLGGELIAKNVEKPWINENNAPLPGDDPVAGTVSLTNGAEGARSDKGVRIYDNTSRRGGAIGADGTLIFGELEDVKREHLSLEFQKAFAAGTDAPSEIYVSLTAKASDGYTSDLGVYRLSNGAANAAGESAPSADGSGVSVIALGDWKFRLELPTTIQNSTGEEPLLPASLKAGDTIAKKDFKILIEEVSAEGGPQNDYLFELGDLTVKESSTTEQSATTTDTSGHQFTKTVTFTDTTLAQTGTNTKAPAGTPKPTTLALSASKALIGADGSDHVAAYRNLFTFELEEKLANGSTVLVSTAKNALDEGATVAFPAITYTAEGEHTYVISETPGTDPGIVYDTKSVEVKVAVTKNANNELVASSEQITNGKAASFVNTEKAEQPALEKYVDKGVHSDLAAFDVPFEYDIMAYVPVDADRVVVEDSLVDSLKFVSSADEVSVFAMGADNDHKTTVAQAGERIDSASAVIDGQRLMVSIPDAVAYRGQWVRVNFKAVIDAAARASVESFGADWAEIAANAPVLIDAKHAGVKNAASYRVFVKNPDGTFPQYPSGENPDDPNGGGDKPKYKGESNTVTVTPPTQELLIEKKWADDKGAIAWPAGAAVTIDVYSVKDGAETKIEGKSVTLDAATPSVKVSGLPELIGVTYTVKESGVADNGEITIADNVYTVSVSGSTVTNTRTGEVPPTPSDNGDITPNANGKIAVQKLWKNSDGSPMAWPQGATVKARLFKADPAGGADALVTEVSLSAEQPQAVIEGLEKGASYRLVEVGADNGEFVFADDVYRVSVAGSTVTNTFDREVPPTPGGGGEEFTPNANGKIAVQKLWKDASGSELTWPTGATVTVKLYKTGAQGAADAFVRDIVLTADEPRQEVSGLEPDAKYRLVEADTENGEFVFADMVYAVTVDGTTVTNTRTGEVPPTPSDNGDITPNANGKIAVQKLWKGADGAAIAWPEGAVVTLNVVKADDGRTVKTVELASAEPVEVSGLEPGASYRLVEVGADNGEFVFADDVYRVSVAGSTVTNTFDREVPPTPGGGGEEFTPNANGKIAVQKLWKDA